MPLILAVGALVLVFLPRPLNRVIRTAPNMRYSYQLQFGSPVVNEDSADSLISALGNIHVVFAGWSRYAPGDGPLLVLRTQDNRIVESLLCVNGETMIYKNWIVGMIRYRPVEKNFQKAITKALDIN